VLISEYESKNTISYDDEYFVILPSIPIKGLKEHYAKYKSVNFLSYSSGEGLMNKADIKNLLKKGGFI
jgi:UDP-N-acetylglucosamine 4,6-dehydratase